MATDDGATLSTLAPRVEPFMGRMVASRTSSCFAVVMTCMRAWTTLMATLTLLACRPADEEPEADVLGDNFEAGESASTDETEGDGETGPKAECTAPLEAIGVGNCPDVLGYQWGPECDPIYGCSCEGEGCATLFTAIVDCWHAYAHCDPCEACTTDQACVITCGHIANDFYDILCVDKCEGCSICPEGYSNAGGGCPLYDPPSDLPYYECHIED